MKKRWTVLGFAAFATLVVLALAGVALGDVSRTRHPSSFEPRPEGLLAFRRLLDSEGIATRTLDRPFQALTSRDGGPEPGLLIVATPLRRAVLEDEAVDLRHWVRRGGRLLVVDDAALGEEDGALREVLDSAGLEVYRQVTDLDPATLAFERPRRTAAAGTEAVPGGAAVRRVMLHEDAGIHLDLEAIPLAIDDDGDVLAADSAVGRGRIVLVLGPLLANDRILDGDGLRLALAILDDLGTEQGVLFDEYHQGFGGLLVSFEDLDRAALLWAGIQSLLAIGLYTLARGKRFGPPVPSEIPPRRSQREFVDAMASMYRRAEARRHAVRASLDRTVRDLRSRFELDERSSVADLTATIEGHGGRDATSVGSALERAERLLRQPRIGDREMIAAVRALEAARMEVLRDDRSGP